MPTNIATVNSNCRLATCTSTNVPLSCQKDTYTGQLDLRAALRRETRAIDAATATRR